VTPSRAWTAPASPSTSAPSQQQPAYHGPRSTATPGIRDLISRIRSSPSRSAATRAAQRATAESLRTRLDTARAEITRLRAENTMLREQAARHLGEQRAAIHPAHPASPGDTDPATPITSRQRHVHHAKTPHDQGLSQTDLR
jgi:hypothetical protein